MTLGPGVLILFKDIVIHYHFRLRSRWVTRLWFEGFSVHSLSSIGIMQTLEKYSFGVGDRFAHQAAWQLRAFQKIADDGCLVIPVWNKSNREHTLIGSEPASVYRAAELAVAQQGWSHPWHVDADHIRLETVDRFLDSSDFFTIDVAESIGQSAPPSSIEPFIQRHPEFAEPIPVAGLSAPLEISKELLYKTARQYMAAIQEAGRIFRHIESHKGSGGFIAEVSMDETDQPQSPQELLILLAALADEGVALQTIAPKFSGRFNKGVDYVGSVDTFEIEFRQDLAVLAHAVQAYGLPGSLKLSVHSGSDKFSLYPVINSALFDTGAGIHLKTAGTTWLEELIGLSEAEGDGVALVKELYAGALDQFDALCAPYASVIDVDVQALPSLDTAQGWAGSRWAVALRHDRSNPNFNPSLRQLMHVAFKLAAKAGTRYTDLLEANAEIVGRNVFENLYARHMKPLFSGLK